MEMGTAYLPINQNWNRYIKLSNSVYDDLQREMKANLMKLANEGRQNIHGQRFVVILPSFHVLKFVFGHCFMFEFTLNGRLQSICLLYRFAI